MSNTPDASRPVGLGIKRGLKHHCPNCGEGELFSSYLKVNAECEACGHDLSQYRADDGPAYLTILIVGHLLVAPAFFFPIMWEASPWITVPASLLVLAGVVLALLPRIKGGFIGLLWANRVTKDQVA